MANTSTPIFSSQNMKEFFSPFRTCSSKQTEFIQKYSGSDAITQEKDLDTTKSYLWIYDNGLARDSAGRFKSIGRNHYQEATFELIREWQDSTRNCTFPKKDIYGVAINHKMIIRDGLVYRARFIRWDSSSQNPGSWKKE